MSSIVKYLILIICIIALYLSSTIYALDNPVGEVLFFDDFKSGNLNNWVDEIGTGGWSINGENLLAVKVGTLKSSRLNSVEGDWDNYSVEVDVTNQAGVDEGVGFRRSSTANAYEVTLRHGQGSYNTPQILLNKIQDGLVVNLASSNQLPLANYTWYHLKIDANLDNIQVWVDNKLIFDVKDTGTTVKKGPISLSSWTGDHGISIVRFDNVKVTALSKPLTPVIFIPGIGGSELKATQEILWQEPDGHGGIYFHSYKADEQIWINQIQAVNPGNDDYFDVLRLQADGKTSQAPISINGNLTPFGYPEIESFFQNLGYKKGTNFFIFAYDWRQDIKTTSVDLDNLVEYAKRRSSSPKVNIVAHSMGGLVTTNYLHDSINQQKVHKFIGLGVPYLGSVKTLKTLLYGVPLNKSIFNVFNPGIPASEVKDVAQNMPSFYQLLPTIKYYDFYQNTDQFSPFPFFDERDIDNNHQVGPLNYYQTKTLLENLNQNSNLLKKAEEFHSFNLTLFSQPSDTSFYNIVGSGQPTLGQIKEGWLIDWPIKLIPNTDEFYINGDETVPLYSSTLINSQTSLGNSQTYYVKQNHLDLVSSLGDAMGIVKIILAADNQPKPPQTKSQKIPLQGKHLFVDSNSNLDLYDEDNNHTGINDQGEIETKIPQTWFDTTTNSQHAFVKPNAPKIKVTASNKHPTPSKTNITIRDYANDNIVKTSSYKNIILETSQPITFPLNPTQDTVEIVSNGQLITPIIINHPLDQPYDQIAPQTEFIIQGDKDLQGNLLSEATITLNPMDAQSGVAKTEYTFDNGATLTKYDQPVLITAPGEHTMFITSTDKALNEEIPQKLSFTILSLPITLSPTPSPTPTPTLIPSPTVTPTAQPAQPTVVLNPASAPTAKVLGIKTQVFSANPTPTPYLIETHLSLTPAKSNDMSPTNQDYLWFLVLPATIAVIIPFVVIYLLLSPAQIPHNIQQISQKMDDSIPKKDIS